MPDIPEPDRPGGVIYACPERVSVDFAAQKCGHPFIFRSSYEKHWREEHGDVSVPYDPEIVALSADPRTPFIHPAAEHVVPWTEVDRKEATARLDTYLEQTTRKDTTDGSQS